MLHMNPTTADRPYTEAQKIAKAKHYAGHSPEILAKKKERESKHPEKVKEWQKKADDNRREKHKAQKRERYAALDHEEYREKRVVWRAENPEIVRAAHKRRKARVRGAAISDFTAEQWRIVQETFDHCCAYCKKRCKGRLTQDHVVPLILGGNHTLSNIVPACQTCNSRKHAGPVPVPVQPLLLAVPSSVNPNAPTKKKKAA